MKKEQITRFNLEDAFKALDEIEVPKTKKGIQANKNDLVESFKDFRRSRTDLLMEDYYDLADSDDLEQAKADREAEVAKAKLAKIEKIVDLEAESEEDILPSYVGKMIIQCPQCMTLFYKDEADVVNSEENEKVVNVAEACQHCGNESGYNLIGKVEGVQEEELMPEDNIEDEAQLEEPVADDELSLEPVDEVDKTSGENAENEEELEAAPIEDEVETEEKVESLQTETSEILTEAVDSELQTKLDAHNDYIKYLQEEIEKEEKALEEAKNNFIKEAIQRRLDALKADLDNALPEEVKNEVAQEEAPIEEVEEIEAPEEATEETPVIEEEPIEEKEEVKESLTEAMNESDIDKREKKNFIVYGCDADYKEIAKQEVSCFEAEVRKLTNKLIKENPEVIYVYVVQIVDNKEVIRDDLEVVRAGYGVDMYDYFNNDAETEGYNVYGCDADYKVILDDQVKTLTQVEEAKKEMLKDAKVIYIYVDQLIDGQEIQRDDLEAVRAGFEDLDYSEEALLAEGSLGIDPKEVDKDISDKEFDQLLNSFSEELAETDEKQVLVDLEDLDEKAFAEKIGKALIKESIDVKGVKIKNCTLDSSNRLVIESIIKLQDKSVKNLTCICENISYNKQLKSYDIVGMTEGCISKTFNCSCKNINNENKILIAESLNFIK